MAGLVDRLRSGRPRQFTAVTVVAITALACTLPAETRIPLSRWSSAELAAEAVTRGVTDAISASTVRRTLARAVIKPWQHRSWIFPRDPDFEAKATRVLDLYARTIDGVELSPDDYVISADEKSQLQALHRRHPGWPTGPGHPRQVKFEPHPFSRLHCTAVCEEPACLRRPGSARTRHRFRDQGSAGVDLLATRRRQPGRPAQAQAL